MAFASLADVRRQLIVAGVLDPSDISRDQYIQPLLDQATEWVRDNYGGNWDAPNNLSTLAAPVISSVTSSPIGGVLTAGEIDFYVVTALDSGGLETVPSAEHSITVATGTLTASNTISWAAVAGATGYRVYGRSAGTEQLLATVVTTSYVDNGQYVPNGALPTQVQESFYTIRQGELLKLKDRNPTNISVRAFWLADGAPFLIPQFIVGQFMDTGQWILQNDGMLQLVFSGYMTPIGLEGAVTRALPGTYQLVQVTYNPSTVIPFSVREAVSLIAAANFNTTGVAISGIHSESVGQYSYSSLGSQLMIPERARQLLGTANYRFPLAVVV